MSKIKPRKSIERKEGIKVDLDHTFRELSGRPMVRTRPLRSEDGFFEYADEETKQVDVEEYHFTLKELLFEVLNTHLKDDKPDPKSAARQNKLLMKLVDAEGEFEFSANEVTLITDRVKKFGYTPWVFGQVMGLLDPKHLEDLVSAD